jgi:hypothetical protein
MHRAVLVLISVLLTGCGTPYGMEGSLGGVRTWTHPNGDVEILVVGSHHQRYERLVRMWRIKAEEITQLRGSSAYDVISFSTGREILGVEVIGEGSNIERYADETPFWTPKVARGVIRVKNPRTAWP